MKLWRLRALRDPVVESYCYNHNLEEVYRGWGCTRPEVTTNCINKADYKRQYNAFCTLVLNLREILITINRICADYVVIPVCLPR